MQKLIELKPDKESTEEWEALEKRLKEHFKKTIYYPLLIELGLAKKKLQNAKNPNPLIEALYTGRITFNRGTFSGKFNSTISKALRDLGARYDRKQGTYKLLLAELPLEVKNVIYASDERFQQKLRQLDKKIASLVPEEIAAKFKSTDLFDRALWKADRSFHENVKNITVAPVLPPEQREKIAKEWSNNMKLWIKGWTEEEIKSLRAEVQKSHFEGNRWGSLVKTIQKSYGVSADKAKFLARQETHLLMSKYKSAKYQSAGVNEYIWRTVKQPHDKDPKIHTPGNVRYSHGVLDGKVFRWSDPPITTNPGEPVRRNNPGEDFNCFPGSTLISLDRPIYKIFRRLYEGELTKLVYDGGSIEATINHPILTNRGWIAVKDVQIGDYIFQNDRENFHGFKVNSENMKASFEDVFDSFKSFGKISTRIITNTDFHGDVTKDYNVEIISPQDILSLNTITQIYKMVCELLFQSANSSTLSGSYGKGTLRLKAAFPNSLISFSNLLLTFFERFTAHGQFISLRNGTQWNASICNPPSNNSSINTIFQSDRFDAHSILIILSWMFPQMGFPALPMLLSIKTSELELFSKSFNITSQLSSKGRDAQIGSFIEPLRVIEKSFRQFRGHVYNLETSNNWYYANNIVCHNCRCFAQPVLRVKEET